MLEKAVEAMLVLVGLGILGGLWMWGASKIIRAMTLARKIEQNILNQIEAMVKAKLEKEAEN